jgi:hypothetical protein
MKIARPRGCRFGIYVMQLLQTPQLDLQTLVLSSTVKQQFGKHERSQGPHLLNQTTNFNQKVVPFGAQGNTEIASM